MTPTSHRALARLALTALPFIPVSAAALEEPAYESVAHVSGVELRRYPDLYVVAAGGGADFVRAGNRAFRPLFRYISGANASSTEMAMTAPVLQTWDTAQWWLAFVVPADIAAEAIPVPTEPDLTIQKIPGGLMAAARFSGRWTEARFLNEELALSGRIAAAGLFICGPSQYARYDAPFKPPFLRRNEVLIPVSEWPCPARQASALIRDGSAT